MLMMLMCCVDVLCGLFDDGDGDGDVVVYV